METTLVPSSLFATSNSQDISKLLSQLPKQTYFEDYELYQWQGTWYSPAHLEGTFAAQKLFEARDDDIILTSSIKSGTTWLKSLVSCIINFPQGDDDDPLIKNNPHHVVSTLEAHVFVENLDISTLPSPRIFHTHLPYNSLPDSIKISNCKIVYIARDAKDTFVSLWHFLNTVRTQEQGPFPIEEAFESFCNGVQFFGPSLDHVLEYWNKSLVFSNKILFLKYEEMKRNPKEQVLKLASFLGKSFANDEELDSVLWRSSFERLKNLDVNKSKSGNVTGFAKCSFFRLGTTGDWKNYFTKEMQERLDRIIRLKYEGSGLNLEI
ncbi:Cytosolic sulfotransferase [Thalictrum thalictroides]|uniref:Sulfotransferase n=1 Tax=Thalictrum thalictroides TaxID=46969 RepID=A0A7J6WZ63_THATH|nr:Cytosolic sulfotransferase [Thalictrum thalictroides]